MPGGPRRLLQTGAGTYESKFVRRDPVRFESGIRLRQGCLGIRSARSHLAETGQAVRRSPGFHFYDGGSRRVRRRGTGRPRRQPFPAETVPHHEVALHSERFAFCRDPRAKEQLLLAKTIETSSQRGVVIAFHYHNVVYIPLWYSLSRACLPAASWHSARTARQLC